MRTCEFFNFFGLYAANDGSDAMPFYGIANSISAGRIWSCFVELASRSGEYFTVSVPMLSGFSRRILAGDRDLCTSKTYVVAIMRQII